MCESEDRALLVFPCRFLETTLDLIGAHLEKGGVADASKELRGAWYPRGNRHADILVLHGHCADKGWVGESPQCRLWRLNISFSSK